MAKSLRSKTQRANRAKKRDRYSVKEMAKLKKVVEAVKEAAADQEVKSTFTVIGENEESMAIDNPVNMPVSSTNPASDVQGSAEQDDDAEDLPMGVTKKTAHGNYPAWMNGRAIKRAKLAVKKKAKQKKRAQRGGSKPWKK